MDTGYKIYAEIMRSRLEEYLEEGKKLGDTQFGFRKGRGTIDAVFVLKSVVENELKKEGGKVWAFMAHLKGAFDNIKRDEIWKEMERMEVDRRLITRIKEIYEETKCEVVIEKEKIGQFKTEHGVRQGCPLSPTLFNVSMADLELEMSRAQKGGIVIGKKKIYSIGYADDVILLANNEVGMKQMIKRFGRYIERRGLELNIK